MSEEQTRKGRADVFDALTVTGVATVTGGVWALAGWAWALIAVGSLLLMITLALPLMASGRGE